MKTKFLGILLCVLSVTTITHAQSSDQTPPEIANVQVVNNSETSITITWETDEDADSLVNYGLKEDYGIVRIPETDRVQHSMTLDELEPGRVYHFRVVSADEEGNQGISADYQVRADDASEVGSGTDVGPGQTDNPPTVTNETITETLGVKFILMKKARSACAAHPQDEPYQARQHTICCYDFKFVL